VFGEIKVTAAALEELSSNKKEKKKEEKNAMRVCLYFVF